MNKTTFSRRFSATGDIFSRRDTTRIKGIAVVLMLYHHLFAFPNRMPEGAELRPLLMLSDTCSSAYFLGQTGKLCVALFLFLGGYGSYLSLKKATTPDQLDRGLLKKLSSLYSSYWKVFFIAVPVSVLLGSLRLSLSDSALLWNLTGLKITFNGEWWFFTAYVILTLLFPLIRRFLDRPNAGLVLDIALCVGFSALVRYVLPALADLTLFSALTGSLFWAKLYQALLWAPCFVMGSLFAKYELLDRIKRRCSAAPVCSCLLAVVLVLCVFQFRYALKSYYYYDYLFAPILVAAFTAVLSCKRLAPFGAFFELIGEESTSIWLLHSFFCYHWCPELVYAPKYTVLIALWLLILSYLSAVVIRLFYRYLARGYTCLRAKAGKTRSDLTGGQ